MISENISLSNDKLSILSNNLTKKEFCCNCTGAGRKPSEDANTELGTANASAYVGGVIEETITVDCSLQHLNGRGVDELLTDAVLSAYWFITGMERLRKTLLSFSYK
jgi:hypothetical protein